MATAIDLGGKWALITGGGNGIGRAIAARLAQAGAGVIVADLRIADAEEAAEEIAAETGGDAVGLGVDVADPASVEALAADITRRGLPLDILVNNAGVMERTGIADPGLIDSWKRVTGVIADGTAYVSHTFVDRLIASQGVIVNTASINSFAVATTAAAYVAAKGAVAQLTKVMAVDLAAKGVRVNAVAPGIIATAMTADTRDDPDAIGRFLAAVPMGRVGAPEEVADAVLFLSSDLARYITGEILAVDGGYLAR